MSINADDLRDVLSEFASGVTVVTGHYEHSNHAATMTAFCSVSLSPPRVLICVTKDSRSHRIISSGGIFAINMLDSTQSKLARDLAQTESEEQEPYDKLKDVPFTTAITGAPILSESHSFIDCVVIESVDIGDHTVFFGEPKAVGRGKDKPPLVYYKRQFGQFIINQDDVSI